MFCHRYYNIQRYINATCRQTLHHAQEKVQARGLIATV